MNIEDLGGITMREIKFRAFYKPLKLMIPSEKLESINFETKVLGVYITIENRGFHKLRMSDFDLIQYTGLYDDTDETNEIYEGHILKVPYEDRVIICKVMIDSGGTMLVSNDFEDGYLWAHELLENDGRVEWIEGSEIIGNIYDNPELLEG